GKGIQSAAIEQAELQQFVLQMADLFTAQGAHIEIRRYRTDQHRPGRWGISARRSIRRFFCRGCGYPGGRCRTRAVLIRQGQMLQIMTEGAEHRRNSGNWQSLCRGCANPQQATPAGYLPPLTAVCAASIGRYSSRPWPE